MEHHLGLTCDPICGLVQIPCIERNAVAAKRAIDASNLAHMLVGTRTISFDMVVRTMYETGINMSRAFRVTCFYGCFALGSLYWTLYLLLFSETPQVFYVSEFGWIASVIFLYLLQYTLSSAEERDFSTRKSLIAPLIGVPLCVFYCTFGDVPFFWFRHDQNPDDRCFLSFYPGSCLCADTDGNSV